MRIHAAEAGLALPKAQHGKNVAEKVMHKR